MPTADLMPFAVRSDSVSWRLLFIIIITGSSTWLSGCAKPEAAEGQKAVSPAKVENAVKESERDGMIQKVLANPGQTVASGAPLFEVVNLSTVWIRVPVYVGDLRAISRRQTARVYALNAPPGAPSRPARPVSAPPTANPTNDTADLYFALANGDNSLRPGQKMGVTLSERASEESLVVPWSAILHDTTGGTWVYENTAPQQYMRRRVEVRRVVNSLAVLARGPAAGTKVVTASAAEIFGTEFGTGK